MSEDTRACCGICGTPMVPRRGTALGCPNDYSQSHNRWVDAPVDGRPEIVADALRVLVRHLRPHAIQHEGKTLFTLAEAMTEAADTITALRAEVEEVKAEHAAMLGDWDRMKAQLSARDAEVDQLKKDLVRQMAWKTEAQDERDALSDVLSRNGFVPCDIAACNCGAWHARYGLSERWDELRDDLADAGHPLCNENGNIMRNALASLVAERDLFRRETVALAKDAMKIDAEVRALREAVQSAYGVLWCVNNEPGTPHRYSPEKAAYEVRKALRDLLTNEQRGEGINAAIAVLRATPLLTGEPGPGGGR